MPCNFYIWGPACYSFFHFHLRTQIQKIFSICCLSSSPKYTAAIYHHFINLVSISHFHIFHYPELMTIFFREKDPLDPYRFLVKYSYCFWVTLCLSWQTIEHLQYKVGSTRLELHVHFMKIRGHTRKNIRLPI